MKKILFCILTVVCVITLTAGAQSPFLRLEFSCDPGENPQKGDVVTCTVRYTDINEAGLSSIEFSVDFSDGLEFNNDAVATGIPSGWELWKPNVSENGVKFAVVDDTVVTPCKNDIEITFSFTVASDKVSREYVQLTESYIYDFDTNEVGDIDSSISHSPFMTNIPDVSVENVGASLRINKSPALRFGLKYDVLPDGAKVGVLVCETAKLDGELTHSTTLSKELDAVNKVSDGFYCTNAFEISSNFEKYTFRPFVMLPMSDGGEYYLYFDALERSASDVAAAELEDETDETLREILKGFSVNS